MSNPLYEIDEFDWEASLRQARGEEFFHQLEEEEESQTERETDIDETKHNGDQAYRRYDDGITFSPFASSSLESVSSELQKVFPRSTPTANPSDTHHEDAEDEDETEEDDDDDDDYDSSSDELGPSSAGDDAFQSALRAAEESMSREGGGVTVDLLQQILNRQKDQNKPRNETDEDSTQERHTTIADDTIDIQIYDDTLLDLDLNEAILKLAALRLAVIQFLDTYTSEYIWHRDAIDIKVCAPSCHSQSTAPPPPPAATPNSKLNLKSRQSTSTASGHSLIVPHLHSTICYGENTSDEWFVLWLMIQLTSHFPSLSVLARDSDGEVLAIEVADYLPIGLEDPSKGRNRIWLRRGMLHLLPTPRTPSELDYLPVKPTVEQALRILKSGRVATTGSKEVQHAMLKKMEPYVKASLATPFRLANDSLSAFHHARVLLPLSLAIMLHEYPQLVAEWVHSFFYRDQLDMKRGNKMAHILGGESSAQTKSQTTAADSSIDADSKQPLNSSSTPPLHSHAAPSTDMTVPFVWTRIRFTHCLYAQLVHQSFGRPKIFTRYINDAISSSGTRVGPTLDKAIDIGIKLSVGAEMWLANRRSELAKRVKRAHAAKAKLKEQTNVANFGTTSDAVIAWLKRVQSRGLRSLDEIDSFVRHDPEIATLLPTIKHEWAIFKAQLDQLNIHSLLGGTTADAATHVHTILSHFAYSLICPHDCVDLDGPQSDDIYFDPLLARSLDINHHQAPHTLMRLPSMARIIQKMDQLSTARDDIAAMSQYSIINVNHFTAQTFQSLPRDDSEDWLQIDATGLESMMQASIGPYRNESMDLGGVGMDGEAIVKSMNQFVKKLSDVEGVVAPKQKAQSNEPTSSTHASATKVRIADAPISSSAAPAAAPAKTLSKEPPKSILKKSSIAANSTAHSSPIASASAPTGIDIDPDELMRLLASVESNPAAFAFPTDGSSPIDSFNQHLISANRLASTLQSRNLPDSDSDDDHAIIIGDEDDGDDGEMVPTAENTRLPRTNRYAQMFGLADEPDTVEEKVPMDDASNTARTSISSGSTSSSSHSQPTPPPHQSDTDQPNLTDYMDEMDQQLQQAGFQSSYVHDGDSSLDSSTLNDPNSTVNVDVNLLSNLLQSHAAELDMAAVGGSQAQTGPVTSIMASMGIQINNNNSNNTQ